MSEEWSRVNLGSNYVTSTVRFHTDSDYTFGIFKLFLMISKCLNFIVSGQQTSVNLGIRPYELSCPVTSTVRFHTQSDYPFGIIKLFLMLKKFLNFIVSRELLRINLGERA